MEATQVTDDAHLQPEESVVLQQEAVELGTIPVCVQDVHGPVRVQVLPRKGGSTRTIPLTTTPKRILRADHWRASALLIADAEVYYAFSMASAQDLTTMARLPSGVFVAITADVEVWVRATTGTAGLSVTTENWAEGE